MVASASSEFCLVGDCPVPNYARGYCSRHYKRVLVHGDPNVCLRSGPKPAPRRPCAIEDCAYPAVVATHGLCNTHIARRYRGVRVDAPLTRQMSSPCSHQAAHSRISRLWGPAKEHPCVGCDGPAQDWAYDGTDETAIMEIAKNGTALVYSLYPEFYMPMCKKCHSGYDGAKIQAELREYREWKYRTGLTIHDLPEPLQGDRTKPVRIAGAGTILKD